MLCSCCSAQHGPDPVMTNVNIKVLVDLKLQLGRHIGTLTFT